ncbi:MAG: 3-hydroxyacyl-CoA dehydrogenase NAD-binding domain-containing protein [Chitinophagales bacterium]|jgi:3-hydroxyacyl-CoA dehydrogenase/enoyl-CoA hydratase/3-hydroxybutyryl-CoA epimerase|nr:3-hydroxyacyl-CoA dehydrogenase NAD-binding domain-containing protein [Chitinophagales bacterium]
MLTYKISPISQETIDLLLHSEIKEGICIITIDMKEEPTNLFNLNLVRAYHSIIHKYAQDPSIKGYIIRSAKKEFIAGADLREMFALGQGDDAQDVLQFGYQLHMMLRDIEKVTKPKVCIINGTCLGGGYEFTLSTNYRISLNSPKIKIGLPEIQLGLFPAGGGASKLPYIIGIQNAVSFVLQAKQVIPELALKEGIIDALAADEAEAMLKASTFIQENSEVLAPWDNKKHRIPGGGLFPGGAQIIAGANGNFSKMTKGNIPAGTYYLSCVFQGLQLPMDRAVELESRYLVKAFGTKQAKHMIRTLFLNLQNAKKGKNKPQGHSPVKFNKVGVLGAGMMGAGIAYAAAISGIQVVLKDTTKENAEKGKSYSHTILSKRLGKGMTEEKMKGILGLIHPTESYQDLKDCDIIIEAVFEDPKLKYQIIQEAEAVIGENTLFSSNTSTLPITHLSKASKRPQQFIGLHFFSPVDKMQLVEIIVGQETSEKSVANAIDFVTQIGKIPIVVNDSRGFYTSRVFGISPNEGALLLQEGVHPAAIDRIARKRGLMVGPLQVTDEVSLELVEKVAQTTPKEHWPEEQKRHIEVISQLTSKGRLGKKVKKGFYDYTEEGKRIWPELLELFPPKDHGMTEKTIGDRIMHRMALETYRCLDEKVLRTKEDGDIGSIFGFGFAPHTGGTLSYIDFVGLAQFVKECDELAKQFGPRFEVPDSLRKLKSIY